MVDSGNLSYTPDKLDLTTSILSELNYAAIGIGRMDLQVGDEFFQQTAAKNLTVLDAAPGARESAVPYVIKDVGGVKVGIVSFGEVNPNSGCNTYELRKSLYSAYKAARDASDVLILLDQAKIATQDWLERNGARLGVPDIVVGGVANIGLAQERIVGKTHIVPTFMQGKYLGVVDVQVSDGGPWKMTVRRIMLDQSVPEDEQIAKRIEEELLKIRREARTVVSASNPGSAATRPVMTDRDYYPSQVCKSCHASEYEDWRQSKHARSLKTLLDESRAIPECLTCHSEMYRRIKRVVMPRDGIGGVECAACHLDSLPHGMERRNVTAKAKVDPRACVTCHTTERSPNYDEKTYLSLVSHKPARVSGTASSAGAK